MILSRLVVLGMVAVAIAPGCSTEGSPTASSSLSASSSAQSPAAAPFPAAVTVSQFDPQWMTLEAPRSWNEVDRGITGEFQQFGLRPVDETEMPRKCNGCGVQPPTAVLTAYGTGKFDPTEARTGEPVAVNADGDGFLRASRDSDDAVLAWEYADGAWATVRGRTTITSEPARMTELARALRPGARTAIRLPLSIPGLPESLPLAEISVNRGAYGTTLRFAACGSTDIGAIPGCYGEADNMGVQIWRADGYDGHIQEQRSVPVQIGGRDGLYDPVSNRAAVQVQPGMLVVFELSGPWRPVRSKPQAALKDILMMVVWVSDPGNEQTWLPVADWVTRN